MNKVTVTTLDNLKAKGEKIVCLTAYDASFAALIDKAGIELILVGDSLGMVIQGRDSTLPVSVDDIIYHTKSVARPCRYSLVIADMPFMSYSSIDLALKNATRIIQEAGAHMVKLEGGAIQVGTVKALAANNIAVCAHLGLQPQSINMLGSYKVQGRDVETAERILHDALELEKAGAKLLVLECVPEYLAKKITASLQIPTIGIGAGANCDGQVLVLYDILGISFGKIPKFAKNYLVISGSVETAIKNFAGEVKTQKFPSSEHSFT